MPRGEEEYDAVVRLLREISKEIAAPFLKYGLAAERDDTPEAAALELRRHELEDMAIRAVREHVRTFEGEWGALADVVEDSEAWWLYMVLVERAYGTLPDQISDARGR